MPIPPNFWDKQHGNVTNGRKSKETSFFAHRFFHHTLSILHFLIFLIKSQVMAINLEKNIIFVVVFRKCNLNRGDRAEHGI